MRNILIVDDHEIVRRGLRALLAEKMPGTRFEEAATSAEAEAKIFQGRWDLILLDLNLPGRNGLEVLDMARRHCPKTPVIVLTVYPEAEFALRAIKLGAQAYLNKQTAAEELLAAVNKVLSGGKYITTTLAEQLTSALSTETPVAPHESLTERELQVLRLVAQGRTTKEIAAELHLSAKTIATYRSRIAAKTGLSTTVGITRYAMQHRLVE
ncbi:MAG: response regulator transcription factor [Verrucomicrobiae bacterium]|nr:response regulator transcription factor [Verrucomicrobiae bacterium]